MRWIRSAGIVAVATAGGMAARRVLAARLPAVAGGGREPNWLVATIYRAPTDIAPEGRLPEPLDRLGAAVEVQIRPAPGDRGAELWVRPRPGRKADRDAWRRARLALREAKQLCETGEILQPDRPATTRPTPLNRPLEYVVSRAREEGRL